MPLKRLLHSEIFPFCLPALVKRHREHPASSRCPLPVLHISIDTLAYLSVEKPSVATLTPSQPTWPTPHAIDPEVHSAFASVREGPMATDYVRRALVGADRRIGRGGVSAVGNRWRKGAGGDAEVGVELRLSGDKRRVQPQAVDLLPLHWNHVDWLARFRHRLTKQMPQTKLARAMAEVEGSGTAMTAK
jgi:hypothetical protein